LLDEEVATTGVEFAEEEEEEEELSVPRDDFVVANNFDPPGKLLLLVSILLTFKPFSTSNGNQQRKQLNKAESMHLVTHLQK